MCVNRLCYHVDFFYYILYYLGCLSTSTHVSVKKLGVWGRVIPKTNLLLTPLHSSQLLITFNYPGNLFLFFLCLFFSVLGVYFSFSFCLSPPLPSLFHESSRYQLSWVIFGSHFFFLFKILYYSLNSFAVKPCLLSDRAIHSLCSFFHISFSFCL